MLPPSSGLSNFPGFVSGKGGVLFTGSVLLLLQTPFCLTAENKNNYSRYCLDGTFPIYDLTTCRWTRLLVTSQTVETYIFLKYVCVSVKDFTPLCNLVM